MFYCLTQGITWTNVDLLRTMMTSSNGNIFRVTGPLCGEFTGHRWIPHIKASDAELWHFRWSAPWINGWANNREAGELRRHHAHYDVIVMTMLTVWGLLCCVLVMLTLLSLDKSSPFRRRHFQTHFHGWKVLYFDSNFTEVCPYGFNRQWVSINSGNGLILNKRQVIKWSNTGPGHWRIYTVLGGDKLTRPIDSHDLFSHIRQICVSGTEIIPKSPCVTVEFPVYINISHR